MSLALSGCVGGSDRHIRDEAGLIGEFAERGVQLAPAAIAGFPIEGCLDDGLATRYDLEGGGWTHVYEYESEQAAREVSEPIPPHAFAGVCGVIDYVADLRYFLWGRVIYTMFEPDAEQLAAAREIAGDPFACVLGGLREPKEDVPRCEFVKE